jgi:hypothetical protein
LEEFNVLEILSNMALKKKEIQRPYGFEGLLRYYVKLTPIRFIEQWVIPEFYNELLLEIFSSWVTPLNGDKDCPNFQCVYCGGEWLSKPQPFDHRFNGYPNAPIDLRTNKPICIPMLPNLAIAHLSKVLKWHIYNNDAFSIQLKVWTQVDVNVETTLEKTPINGKHVHVQVRNFKTFK